VLQLLGKKEGRRQKTGPAKNIRRETKHVAGLPTSNVSFSGREEGKGHGKNTLQPHQTGGKSETELRSSKKKRERRSSVLAKWECLNTVRRSTCNERNKSPRTGHRLETPPGTANVRDTRSVDEIELKDSEKTHKQGRRAFPEL